MTDLEYIEKRDYIFSRFSLGFQQTIHLRAYDNAVVEALIRGADPFEIIQQILGTVHHQGEQIQALALHQPPAPILIQVTKEEFEKIKNDLRP